MKKSKKKISKQSWVWYMSGKIRWLLLGVLIFFAGWQAMKTEWWRFPLDGEMYGTISDDLTSLYVGDTYGGLRAIDKRTGDEAWKVEHEKEVFKTMLMGNKLLTSSGDTLFAYDKKTGMEEWRFTTNTAFDVSDFVRYSSSVVVFDTIGNAFRLSLGDGRLLWMVSREDRPETLSELFLRSSGPRWETEAVRVGKVLVYSPPGGTIYAVLLSNGRVLWKNESTDLVTSLSKAEDGRALLIARKSGLSEYVKIKNGEQIFVHDGQSTLHCAMEFEKAVFQPGELYDTVQRHLPFGAVLASIFHWDEILPNWGVPHIGDRVTVRIYDTGRVIGASGTGEWTISYDGINDCPMEWYDIAYFNTNDGRVLAVHVSDGRVVWERRISEEPILYMSAFSASRKLGMLATLTGLRRVNVPDIMASNWDGTWSLRGRDGSVRWERIDLPGLTTAAYSGGAYYVASARGIVDKIQSESGRPFLRETGHFSVMVDSQTMGENQLFEFTIRHDDEVYVNPLSDVSLWGVFVHGDGTQKIVRGFYYDRDVWKLRFVPDKEGKWNYSLSLRSPLGESENFFDGAFEVNGNLASYLHVSAENSLWLTEDGTTIWNGVGFQDWPLDRNWNGNFYDDYSLGINEGVDFLATTSAGLTFYPGVDTYVGMNNYFNVNGSDGKILSLYRWNLNFPNTSLITSDATMLDLVIDLQKGRDVDTLLKQVKSSDMQVWLTMFNFWFPFAWNADLAKSEAYIRPYIEYFVARYGAFVDVWELTNEANMSTRLLERVEKIYRESDYQKKLLTTNWETEDMKSMDLIAPHWYESEESHESDLVTRRMVENYAGYGRPLMFGEQGNKESNYDDKSAERMRVRLWTAFMHKALLTFWNSSNSIFAARPNAYGNINIGEEERQYIQVFRESSSGLSLDADEIEINLTGCGGVRGYGLKASNAQLFYLVNPIEGMGLNSCYVNGVPSGNIRIIDPSNGDELAAYRFLGGSIRLPRFERDVVVRIDRL